MTKTYIIGDWEKTTKPNNDSIRRLTEIYDSKGKHIATSRLEFTHITKEAIGDNPHFEIEDGVEAYVFIGGVETPDGRTYEVYEGSATMHPVSEEAKNMLLCNAEMAELNYFNEQRYIERK